MRVCFYLLVVLGAVCQFALAEQSSEQELRAEQEEIACELNNNDTLLSLLKSSVRRRHGVDPNFGEPHASTKFLSNRRPHTIR